MFSSLFKPKWQHSDPQVRKQAVLSLGSDERAVMLQIAREDADSGVRQAALKRVVDLDTLWNSAQTDGDEAVREFARLRFLRLLGGEDVGPEDLSARIARLQALTDPKLLEYLARNAAERTLRLAAQQRVDRDALLGDVALGDSDAELRALAAARVTQKSTLERVAKQSRGKDKRVHAIVRDKLQALQEREELPERLRQAARAVCASVEALIDVQNVDSIPARRAPGITEWERVQRQWRETDLGEFDLELTQRYADASAAVDALLARHAEVRAQQQAIEAHHEELRERKRDVCERLEAQLGELNARTEPVDDDAVLRQLLNTVNAAWSEIEALPANEESVWASRFQRVAAELAGYAEQSAQWRAEALALRDVLANAQRLLESEREVTAKQLEGVERRVREARADRHAALHGQIADALAQLRARHAQVGERVRSQRAAIDGLVKSLEEHIAGGQTAAAENVLREVQGALDQLAERELSALRGAGIVNRFNAAAKQLREWSKWKRWAGAPVKEELVATIEALALEVQATPEKDLNHRDIAEHVRLAREQWKKLGATDNVKAGELWKRFDAACTAVYAPCAARFDKEREQRQANAARREAICTELEQFIATVDWENPDWNAGERKLRDVTRAWERPGAIDRGKRKALDARFKALATDLEQRLHKERTRNKFKKEALIKRAQQLVATISAEGVDSRAVNDAINKARELQDEWQKIGMSTDVQALWNQFRAEIDTVFTRRKAVFDIQDQQRVDNLKRKEEQCAEIEACGQLEGEAAHAARGRVANAKSEYQRLGQVPREAEKGLRARFERAVRDYERRLSEVAARKQQAQAAALMRKAAVCTTLENALDRAARGANVDELANAVRDAQQAWDVEPPVAAPMEAKLSTRLQSAIDFATAMIGGERDKAVAEFLQRQEQQRGAADELCMRLEIATGTESPPDQREARMKYQVQRLAQKMRGAADAGVDQQAEVDLIRVQWFATGPLTADDRTRIEARLARAGSVLGVAGD